MSRRGQEFNRLSGLPGTEPVLDFGDWGNVIHLSDILPFKREVACIGGAIGLLAALTRCATPVVVAKESTPIATGVVVENKRDLFVATTMPVGSDRLVIDESLRSNVVAGIKTEIGEMPISDGDFLVSSPGVVLHSNTNDKEDSPFTDSRGTREARVFKVLGQPRIVEGKTFLHVLSETPPRGTAWIEVKQFNEGSQAIILDRDNTFVLKDGRVLSVLNQDWVQIHRPAKESGISQFAYAKVVGNDGKGNVIVALNGDYSNLRVVSPSSLGSSGPPPEYNQGNSYVVWSNKDNPRNFTSGQKNIIEGYVRRIVPVIDEAFGRPFPRGSVKIRMALPQEEKDPNSAFYYDPKTDPSGFNAGMYIMGRYDTEIIVTSRALDLLKTDPKRFQRILIHEIGQDYHAAELFGDLSSPWDHVSNGLYDLQTLEDVVAMKLDIFNDGGGSFKPLGWHEYRQDKLVWRKLRRMGLDWQQAHAGQEIPNKIWRVWLKALTIQE